MHELFPLYFRRSPPHISVNRISANFTWLIVSLITGEHCSHFSRIMHIPNTNIFLLTFISIAINHVIGDETNSFWLSADLLSVEWRKGCLTTAGCADPRFNIIESNMASNERISISWPVTQDIVQVCYFCLHS